MEPGEHNPTETGGLPADHPVEFPSVQPTGDASVDTILEALSAIQELDEADLPGAYERLHDQLLSELNTEHR